MASLCYRLFELPVNFKSVVEVFTHFWESMCVFQSCAEMTHMHDLFIYLFSAILRQFYMLCTFIRRLCWLEFLSNAPLHIHAFDLNVYKKHKTRVALSHVDTSVKWYESGKIPSPKRRKHNKQSGHWADVCHKGGVTVCFRPLKKPQVCSLHLFITFQLDTFHRVYPPLWLLVLFFFVFFSSLVYSLNIIAFTPLIRSTTNQSWH